MPAQLARLGHCPSTQEGHNVCECHPCPCPCQPSGTAAVACAGRGSPGQDEGQAQLGAGQGQQPRQGLSRTHHRFGVSLSDTNSGTGLVFVASLLLKAGSHLNQQHIVARTRFCRNPMKKSCDFSPWQVTLVLKQTHSAFQVQRMPQRQHLKYTFEKLLPSTCRALLQGEQVSMAALPLPATTAAV